jgi:DNA-binding NarL/FixJ family response regulator
MKLLDKAKEYEDDRYRFEGKMMCSRHLRDIYIKEAFDDGVRQKVISQALGLSESTIKHIIAKRKRIK